MYFCYLLAYDTEFNMIGQRVLYFMVRSRGLGVTFAASSNITYIMFLQTEKEVQSSPRDWEPLSIAVPNPTQTDVIGCQHGNCVSLEKPGEEERKGSPPT